MTEYIFEPADKKEGEYVNATDFPYTRLPKPEQCFRLDEKGEFTFLPKKDEKYLLNRYWAKQNRKLGVLLILSASSILVILLNETRLLESLVDGIVGIVMGAVGLFMGLF